jgi:lysyl-tRNA synthetase class 1
MRQAVHELADGMEDDWTLPGLTTLVYTIPKQLLGLEADDAPTSEVKAAQRDFFRAVYRLLVDAETGPRLPTLLLSIGPARARELLVGSGD